MYSPGKLPAACGEWGITTPWMYDVVAAPINITFTESPAGFIPSEYNTHFTGSNMSAVFPEETINLTPPRYEFLKLTDGGGVPPGDYTMKFESCGKEWTKSFNIPEPVPLVLKSRADRYGCGAENAAILLFIGIDNNQNQADDFATVEFTSAPPAFVNQYGALPYDASANIATSGSYPGRFFMNSLPAGTYEVKTTGANCGKVVTGTFTLVERVFEEEVTIKQKCGGNFDVRIDVTSNMYYETYYLQRWYENEQKWGDPFNPNKLQSGTDFDHLKAYKMGDRDPEAANVLGTHHREALNINGLGKYRIVMTQTSYSNGGYPVITNCDEVIEEFEVGDPEIKIINYNVLKCALTGDVTLLVEATGVDPLKYKIIKKDGVPTNAYPETLVPAWEGLDPGTYVVQIEDKCGNTRTVDFATNKAKIPLIKSQNLCDGQNGKIYLDGAGFLDIKWFKDGVDTGETGIEYTFNPFESATDAGMYEAKLYFPSSNAAICVEPVVLDLTTITQVVEAGTGQQNAEVCADLTGFVDLFDYINGEYNNWGDWTDPLNTGALNGSTLDINSLVSAQGVGTYTFKYKVKGHCTGEDETTVKLTLKNCLGDNDCPEIIPPTIATDALTSSQVTMDLNGGYVNSITVVGEPHPFTYLYVPDDASYDIQNPTANSNQIAKNGVIYSDITQPDFKDKLVEANASRDLDFYMMNDFDTHNGDYIQFTFNEPIKSSANRYVVVTERWGNNPYIVNVLNSAHQPMGVAKNTIPKNQSNTNYIPTGFHETSHNQEVHYAVFPLTAFVTPGIEIYGIRLTQNSGAYGSNPNDGGDGKIFILADQFTLAQPPIVEGDVAGVNITPPTCANANGGSISFTAKGVHGKDIECSINGDAGPFQGETQFSNLSAGTYTLRLRYVDFPNCFTDYTIILNSPDCTDSDGDGLPDFEDLDDDNDGILDIDEDCIGFVAQNTTGPWKGDTQSNATVTFEPTALAAPGQWVIPTAQYQFHHDDGVEGSDTWFKRAGNTSMTITFDTPIPASEIAFAVMDIDANNPPSTPIWKIFVNGTQDLGGVFVKQDITGLGYVNDDNVVVANGVITPSYTVVNEYALLIGRGSVMVSSLTVIGEGVHPSDMIGYSFYAYKSCDTDGDGIPDKLDLDSDNDGCLDAIEGGADFSAGDLVTAGGTLTVGTGSSANNMNLCAEAACVDVNGVPNIANGGQGVGSSKESLVYAIAEQPQNREVCAGVNVQFTSKATSTPAQTLNYQWKVSTDGGNTWTNVSQTGSSGTVASGAQVTLDLQGVTATMNDNQYKVVYTHEDNTCNIETEPATLTVNPLPNNTYTMEDISICIGASGTLELSGSQVGVSYQLKKVSDNTQVGPIVPGTGNAITFTVSPTTTTVYKVNATSAADCEITLSDQATVTVNDLPTISGATTVNAGHSITLTGSGTPASTDAWTLNPTTGIATITNGGVLTGTNPGTVTVTYTNISGCKATHVVTVKNAVIDAVDDDMGTVNGANTTTSTTTVFANDKLNGVAVNPSDLNFTPVESNEL